MGIHGSVTAELIFENSRVPRENLPGTEGKVLVAMALLGGGRVGIGVQHI